MKIDEIKIAMKKLRRQIDKSMENAEKVVLACNKINVSWSGSDLAGHSNLFYGNFEVPPHNRRFNIEWGLINGAPDGWNEKSDDEILKKIESDSGVLPEKLDNDADIIAEEFEKLRKQSIIALSLFSKEAAEEIEKFSLKTKNYIFNKYWTRQIITRDRGALLAGRVIPKHKYYGATAAFLISTVEQLNEFLYLIDKAVAQNKSFEQNAINKDSGRTAYIDKNTLLRLSGIKNDVFDLSRLISFCNELDDNYSLGNYHSCAMLLRAILDHIPPVFGKTNFTDVCSQYGSKSFKDIATPLDKTAKKIGDDYLHTQISKKVLVVTKTQVGFQANLDRLLNEVAAILEQK